VGTGPGALSDHAPRPRFLAQPVSEHLGSVEALLVVLLVGERPADHLQHLLRRLADEGLEYGLLLAPQESRGLVAEGPVGDDGEGGWRRGAGYTSLVHKTSPYGPRPGRLHPRRGFFLSLEVIMPGFLRKTSL
jgi:hypothetical protein